MPWVLLFAAQGREQDHVADAGAVGQQHHQAVDADAAAACGGHAVLEGTNEVVVEVHGFVVATVLGLDLGDRKSTRLNSSHLVISYAVFCLKKKNVDYTVC